MYRQADLFVDVDGRSLDETTEAILDVVRRS